MALLSFILALTETYKTRAQARRNLRSVAHLTDYQLKDLGLWRFDNTVGTYTNRSDDQAPPASVKVKVMEKLLEEKSNNRTTMTARRRYTATKQHS